MRGRQGRKDGEKECVCVSAKGGKEVQISRKIVKWQFFTIGAEAIATTSGIYVLSTPTQSLWDSEEKICEIFFGSLLF
jgi:hypothetical protein